MIRVGRGGEIEQPPALKNAGHSLANGMETTILSHRNKQRSIHKHNNRAKITIRKGKEGKTRKKVICRIRGTHICINHIIPSLPFRTIDGSRQGTYEGLARKKPKKRNSIKKVLEAVRVSCAEGFSLPKRRAEIKPAADQNQS